MDPDHHGQLVPLGCVDGRLHVDEEAVLAAGLADGVEDGVGEGSDDGADCRAGLAQDQAAGGVH